MASELQGWRGSSASGAEGQIVAKSSALNSWAIAACSTVNATSSLSPPIEDVSAQFLHYKPLELDRVYRPLTAVEFGNSRGLQFYNDKYQSLFSVRHSHASASPQVTVASGAWQNVPAAITEFASTVQPTDYGSLMAPFEVLTIKVVSLPDERHTREIETRRRYEQIGETLVVMSGLDRDDDYHIEKEICDLSCEAAAVFMVKDAPAPQIFNSGPKSVVFKWTREESSFYATISQKAFSFMMTRGGEIVRREHGKNDVQALSAYAQSLAARLQHRTQAERVTRGTSSSAY